MVPPRLLRLIASDRRGLTVVEVIVSLFIISAALVALAWVMPLSTTNIQQSNLKSTAVFLGQQRLEQVKNAQWTAIPAVDNLTAANYPDEGYNAIAGYPLYRRTVTITGCEGPTNPCGLPTADHADNVNLRQVTVSVLFRPMIGGEGSNSNVEDGVQVRTRIAKREQP